MFLIENFSFNFTRIYFPIKFSPAREERSRKRKTYEHIHKPTVSITFLDTS